MAIPIPNLPTDNLYKFMAIAGLFMVIFSASSLTVVSKYLEIQSQTTSEQRRQILTELDKLESDSIRIGDAIKKTEIKIDAGEDVSKQQLISLKTKIANISERTIKVRQKLNNHGETLAKIAVKSSNLSAKIATFGVFIGYISSVTGFFLWYHRVQKIHDKLLLLNLNRTHNSKGLNEEE